jgi:hypothetical protein
MSILNFKDFNSLNESSSSIGEFNFLPKKLQKFFKDSVGVSVLAKVIGNKSFNIVLEGEDVFFIIKGEKVKFPFIKFINDSVVLDKNIISNMNEYDKFVNEIFPSGNLNPKYDSLSALKRYAEKVINAYNGVSTVYRTSLEDELKSYIRILFGEIRIHLPTDAIINPFTDIDLPNNPWIKLLNSLGYEISQKPTLVKKGTISIEPNKYTKSNTITILSGGYIRRDNGTGRTPQLTTNTDLTRPIYTEEDLNLKLAYVTKYLLKEFLESLSVNKDSINKVISSIGEDPNSINNDILAQAIIDNNNFKSLASIKASSPDSELWKSIERLMGTDTADLATDMGNLGF